MWPEAVEFEKILTMAASFLAVDCLFFVFVSMSTLEIFNDNFLCNLQANGETAVKFFVNEPPLVPGGVKRSIEPDE